MKAMSRDWSWKPDRLARKAMKRGEKNFSTKAIVERRLKSEARGQSQTGVKP